MVGSFGHNGRNAGQFHWVHAMAVDAKGNVYTAEVDTGKRIQKFKLTSDALDRRIAQVTRERRDYRWRSVAGSGQAPQESRPQLAWRKLNDDDLRGALAAPLALAAFGFATPAYARQDKTVKIGVLNDMSSLYADIGGPGSTLAAQDGGRGFRPDGQGLEDRRDLAAITRTSPTSAPTSRGNGSTSTRSTSIVDVPNSGVALAVSNVVKEKNGVLLNSGAASVRPHRQAHARRTPSHWTYDTYMLANGTGKALVKAGGDTWFFLTADYAFGAALERDTTAVVTANGGKVLGGVKHPLNTSDFSSFLLQAQASKAKVIGLANAGGDTTNAIKQAAEFGIVAGGQKLAALLLFITDVHALGLKAAQGLNFTESFYWDLNDQTRAFAKRFQERMKNQPCRRWCRPASMPALLHYLKALEALGGNPHDGAKVVAKMKELPTDDPLFGKGSIRADGRTIHPGLSVRGEEAGRVEGSVGLLQAGRHDPAGRRGQAARGQRVPAGEEVKRSGGSSRRRSPPLGAYSDADKSRGSRFANPPYASAFDRSSVRHAIATASTNNAAASRNGAPGNFSGACAPMK